ncbi:Quercetin 2,3-dioxygenase [Thalassocella blandensis]|nr:Quercetin 2,3-dioxygenase [Thalassocella blandensis]
MSNLQDTIKADCDVEQGCEALDLIIEPKEKTLGGFSVRRSLPHAKCRSVGPWIFFDHMGPAEFDAGQGVNVRPHPHIGLATVTYLFEGEMLHRDSLGNTQAIQPGAINLMVAGKGIVHSERESDEVRNSRHRVHGLQLWLGLPQEDEDIAPAFYHYDADDIPTFTSEGVTGRVLIGEAYGCVSPVKTYSQTLYVELTIDAGAEIVLPAVAERAVYIVSGKLWAQKKDIHPGAMAVFHAADHVVLKANELTRIAIIGGESVGKRFMDWNFVSSSEAKVKAAIAAWKAGEFTKVPGDEHEFIPYPEVKK